MNRLLVILTALLLCSCNLDGKRKNPPPGPPPPPATMCALDEAQRLNALLERDHAAKVRELADQHGGAALTMVPLRLHYDDKGRVQVLRSKLGGYPEFVSALEADARGWVLEGVSKGGICDVAIKIGK